MMISISIVDPVSALQLSEGGVVGLGVTGASISSAGHLLLALANGTTIDAGRVGTGTAAPATEFAWTQSMPAAVWHVTHNLGLHPSVRITDQSGDLVSADVVYVDLNNLNIIFAGAQAGFAYLS